MIVLNTDVLIEIFDRNSKKGEEALNKLEGHEVATTSINLHEIAYGFYKIGKEVPDEIRFLKIFEFTAKDALLSAKIESELEKAGESVGRFDTMIASICINRNAEIATFNVKHFEKFTRFGLRIFKLD